MSDYYCTKCGANLEEQDGFDPSNDSWICTECGALLINPDVDESTARFANVRWFCDKCGAQLNKQSGFSDWYNTWTCTECGHENEISEEHIYESEAAYQKSRKKYECPNCGNILNDQSLFDPDDETYTCSWCDSELFKDGDEYVIQYRCPNCSAVLNSQMFFRENDTWECSNCYKELRKAENAYIECEEYDDFDSDDESSEPDADTYISANDDTNNNKSERKNAKKTRKKRKSRKVTFKTIVISVLAIFIFYQYQQYKKLTPIGVSSVELSGKNYKEVVDILKDNGFRNISIESAKDLDYKSLQGENTVSSVNISGDTVFTEEDKYPYDTKIIIRYHSAEINNLPMSSKDIKGKNYAEVYNAFIDAGFGNVTVQSEEIFLASVFYDDGGIKSMTVDGKKHFDTETGYRVDTDIVIIYHKDKD